MLSTVKMGVLGQVALVIILLIGSASCIPGNFNNLTESQTIATMLECIDACQLPYNYTIGYNNEIILQPFTRRGFNLSRGSPDMQLYFCAFTVANKFWVVLAGNGGEPDDELEGSTQIGSWSYDALVSNMPLLRSMAERPLEPSDISNVQYSNYMSKT
ncbi:hypothetical protein V1525DRAFT_403302 [Lipomyces kononenkoae]|uniref:Uncharacterized protein n=1 Tax=Lipomyces kononenkoae TaxID=34357 RepID=A0ACC3T163_LIPKO